MGVPLTSLGSSAQSLQRDRKIGPSRAIFAVSREFEAELLSRRVAVGVPGHLARGGPATTGRQRQNADPPSCAQGTPTDTLPTS